MEGACLSMKPLHQSLPDLMPHSEWGNSPKVFKPLLSQKLSVPWMGPMSKHQPEKSGPGAPTTEFVAPLHSKSETIR